MAVSISNTAMMTTGNRSLMAGPMLRSTRKPDNRYRPLR